MEATVIEAPERGTAQWRLTTWQLFVIVTVIQVALTWTMNEFVMTSEVYRHLLGDRLEAYRIEDYLDLTRKYNVWGYILTPLVVFVRIAFVALLIQMVLILTLVEIRFERLFRILSWAFFMPLYASAVKVGSLLVKEPSEITIDVLSSTPGALSHLLDRSGDPSPIRLLMNHVSIFELAWCVVAYLGLMATGKLKHLHAGVAVAGVWLALTLFKWGLTLYLTGVNA